MTSSVFEKIRSPLTDEESVTRSLTALLEQSDVTAQATGLANLAVMFASQHPLRALECLQIAFKLAPRSEDVWQAMDKVFELRNDKSAQTKLAALRRGEDVQSTRIKPLDDLQEESRGTRIVRNRASVLEPVPAVKRSSETRVDAQPYGIFRDFIKNAKLNARFLEFAVEFSDDWVGLVQFVSYLFASGHVKAEEELDVGSRLHKMLKDSCPNIKAHVRFSELIEPRITQKS